MKKLFARHIPVNWDTPAEEIVWYLKNLRIDGVPVTIKQFAEIVGLRQNRIFEYQRAAKNRAQKKRDGIHMADPPARSMRLIRLELGVEEPWCKEK